MEVLNPDPFSLQTVMSYAHKCNSSLGIEALTKLNSYYCGIAFLPHSSEYQNFYWDPHQSTATRSSVRHSSSRVCTEDIEAMSTGGEEVNEGSGRAGWRWTFLIASKPHIDVLKGSDARMCWTAHRHVTIPSYCIVWSTGKVDKWSS